MPLTEAFEEGNEKEDMTLLQDYSREDEGSNSRSVPERYIANECRGRIRHYGLDHNGSIYQSVTQWMENTTNRVKEISMSKAAGGLSSLSVSSTRKRLQRRFISAFLSFLVFLKPSFTQLWTNDKPQKLQSTAYLNGLRGVAALFVVFHHYACQFTPALLEGWGTEHDNYWLLQFPVIRVSHNGTLMVEIFFVLSGFVLSVKALRLARQGRTQEFIKSLSSSAFRRWLRLALPVMATLTISLMITRAELWYALPLDWQSANPASVVVLPVAAPVVAVSNGTAVSGAIPITVPPSSQNSSVIEGSIATVPIKNDTSVEDTLAAVEQIVGSAASEKTDLSTSQSPSITPEADAVPPSGNGTNSRNTSLVIRGDTNSTETPSNKTTPTTRIMWLSSPVWMAKRDPSFWKQLNGFVGAVSYIVDPLNTNGVPMVGAWPSYDSGVLWTIPVEWSGSMIVFIVVLGLAWVRPWPKITLMITFAFWGYYSGRGVLTQFVSGAILAELTVARDAWEQARQDLPKFEDKTSTTNIVNLFYNSFIECLGQWGHIAVTTFWSFIFIIGLFLGSFPYAKGDNSIGWSTITSIMKKNQLDITAQHLFFASSILIVLSLNHCASLQRIFNTRIAQYLGRISFSIYLLHMHVLWTVGTRLFPLCMQLAGGGETSQVRYMIGMLLAGLIIFPLQFWISDVFCRAVDEKAISFARWAAGKLLEFESQD